VTWNASPAPPGAPRSNRRNLPRSEARSLKLCVCYLQLWMIAIHHGLVSIYLAKGPYDA
jgi:hypothetical protein